MSNSNEEFVLKDDARTQIQLPFTATSKSHYANNRSLILFGNFVNHEFQNIPLFCRPILVYFLLIKYMYSWLDNSQIMDLKFNYLKCWPPRKNYLKLHNVYGRIQSQWYTSIVMVNTHLFSYINSITFQEKIFKLGLIKVNNAKLQKDCIYWWVSAETTKKDSINN